MSNSKKIFNIIKIAFLSIVSIVYIFPVFLIGSNSLKKETLISTDTSFNLPDSQSFAGFANYVNAINAKGFFKSLGLSAFITITSVTAICILCSMCAWYLVRVKSIVTTILYYMFVLSMVVPFQLVMFSLSHIADSFGYNTPFSIWIIYLGYGAGLAVFMFAGFIKAIPYELEEAAFLDGCNPLQTYFKIILPILKPTVISVALLEAMWIWNDYLLPTLVLDIKKYKTIPMLIQYYRGGYGTVEMGAMMASIILTVIPVIIVYIVGQKYIVEGVAAGAVKG